MGSLTAPAVDGEKAAGNLLVAQQKRLDIALGLAKELRPLPGRTVGGDELFFLCRRDVKLPDAHVAFGHMTG